MLLKHLGHAFYSKGVQIPYRTVPPPPFPPNSLFQDCRRLYFIWSDTIPGEQRDASPTTYPGMWPGKGHFDPEIGGGGQAKAERVGHFSAGGSLAEEKGLRRVGMSI